MRSHPNFAHAIHQSIGKACNMLCEIAPKPRKYGPNNKNIKKHRHVKRA